MFHTFVHEMLHGSSPLARGTRGLRGELCRRDRFIPARAGNTSRATLESASPPVHPRSRGEHNPVAKDFPHSTGSSPLARGTRRTATAVQPYSRFIPARAGNT